jgi:hypothetical protein
MNLINWYQDLGDHTGHSDAPEQAVSGGVEYEDDRELEKEQWQGKSDRNIPKKNPLRVHPVVVIAGRSEWLHCRWVEAWWVLQWHFCFSFFLFLDFFFCSPFSFFNFFFTLFCWEGLWWMLLGEIEWESRWVDGENSGLFLEFEFHVAVRKHGNIFAVTPDTLQNIWEKTISFSWW